MAKIKELFWLFSPPLSIKTSNKSSMCWLVAVGTFMEEYKVLRQQKAFKIDYQVCNISTVPFKWSRKYSNSEHMNDRWKSYFRVGKSVNLNPRAFFSFYAYARDRVCVQYTWQISSSAYFLMAYSCTNLSVHKVAPLLFHIWKRNGRDGTITTNY